MNTRVPSGARNRRALQLLFPAMALNTGRHGLNENFPPFISLKGCDASRFTDGCEPPLSGS